MNQVPWLRQGTGHKPSDGGCIMQVVDWIHSGGWTDNPECVHPVFRNMSIVANDYLTDRNRQRLLDLVPRLMGTATSRYEGPLTLPAYIFLVRLSVAAAKPTLIYHWRTTPHDVTFQAAVRAVETWCDYPCPEARWRIEDIRASIVKAAMRKLDPPGPATPDSQTRLAVDGLCRLATGEIEYGSETSPAGYAMSATLAAGDDAVAHLASTIDEYDRLTGRQSREKAAPDYAPLCRVSRVTVTA